MAKKRGTRRSSSPIRKKAKRSLRSSLPRRRRYVPISTALSRGRRDRVIPTRSTKRAIVVGKTTQRPQKTITKKRNLALFTNKPEKRKMVCKRRAERKQIIHAIRKSGQAGQKTPNNITRSIKC
jgi:hypothetical protein